MPRVVLFTCPVCNSVRALTGTRSELSEDDLHSTAKAHLLDHEIDESKAAIHKYRMVYQTVELIVSKNELEELPTGEWQSPAAVWPPDEVVSSEDAAALLS